MFDENKSLLICLIISVYFQIVLALNDPKCVQQLSNGCELKSYFCYHKSNPSIKKCHFYVCDKIEANFQFVQTEKDLIRNCSTHPEIREALNKVYFRLSKSSILDGSFDLFNNNIFLTSVLIKFEIQLDNQFYEEDSSLNTVTFRYIKGFDVGKFNQRQTPIQMEFYYSNFDFYINGSLIQSCKDIEKLDKFPQYIFDALWISYNDDDNSINDVRFYNSEYKTPICPLAIIKFKISILRLNGIQNTFYKRNYPRFLPIPNTMLLNASYNFSFIIELDLLNMQNIELNSEILNRFLFKDIYVLRLFGDIVSIEKGLFKSFKNLTIIHIDLLSIRKIMYNGNDWLLDLNSEIKVDLNNNNSLLDASYKDFCLEINFYKLYEQGAISSVYLNSYDYFPDEDFCLYLKFPFQQLVSMFFYSFPLNLDDCSCTYLWISKYNRILNKICDKNLNDRTNPFHIFIGKEMENKINKCKFEQR